MPARKTLKSPPTKAQRRRTDLDARVKAGAAAAEKLHRDILSLCRKVKNPNAELIGLMAALDSVIKSFDARDRATAAMLVCAMLSQYEESGTATGRKRAARANTPDRKQKPAAPSQRRGAARSRAGRS